MAPSKRIHWDGTITAGNVLTAGVILLAGLTWGLRLEGRVDQHEYRISAVEQHRVIDRQEYLETVRRFELRVGNQFDDVADRFDRVESILLRPESFNP